MNLKKTLITSIAAVTLLSAGAAVVNQNNASQVVEAKTVTKRLSRNSVVYKANGKRASKKTLKKGKKVKVYGYKKIHGKKYARIGKGKYVRSSNLAAIKKAKATKKSKPAKKPVDTTKAMYKQWIKDIKKDKGNLVAIRDTHEYDTSDDHDAIPENGTNIRAGQPYDIGVKLFSPDDEDAALDYEVEKIKGEYYIDSEGPDGSTAIKASDFTYKPYDAQYSQLKKELDKYTDSYDMESYVTLNQEVASWDGNGKLSAGKKIKIQDPAVMIGNDGYYIYCSDEELDYMIPYSAISNLSK